MGRTYQYLGVAPVFFCFFPPEELGRDVAAPRNYYIFCIVKLHFSDVQATNPSPQNFCLRRNVVFLANRQVSSWVEEKSFGSSEANNFGRCY